MMGTTVNLKRSYDCKVHASPRTIGRSPNKLLLFRRVMTIPRKRVTGRDQLGDRNEEEYIEE